MEAQVLRRVFSVDEFHRMADAGVFAEDDRLELLDGEIVRMTPIGSRHVGCVDRLNAWFGQRLHADVIVHVQNPVLLSQQTEVYPDIALLKGRPDFYSQSLPQPSDVLLVVEVAETTGDYDRRIKVPRYARAGVPEVWVVDLRDRAIDVYRQAVGGEYREQRRVRPGESLVIPGVPDLWIALDQMLT